jgi:hypothetical protein
MKILVACLVCATAASAQVRYNSNNQMLRPENYREWIYLSSGLGMSYGPQAAGARENPDPPFDNVFVDPAAWKAFKETGKWPDKTVMVLELRASSQKGSINQRGHFQTTTPRMEVHVKDERRFPDSKWAFFGFNGKDAAADMTPTTRDCYSCHQEHGALDTTFAQFYPTVKEIAERKGTFQAR